MKFIIVGLGGTGSYLVNHIVHYLKILKKIPRELILIDGDVLEDRNLLRQGFLEKDIGRNKAKALQERFSKIVPSNVKVRSEDRFINSIRDLEDVVGDEGDIFLFSCVDNNMARYRLLMAQHKIYSDSKGKRRVIFIDAGNEEWHGQVLVNALMRGKEVPIEYKENGYEFTGKTEGHFLSTIFDNQDEWESTLSRGEHEISCDIITEAAPQNIVTNMTSAAGMMYMLNKVLKKGYQNTRYQYNVKRGTQEELRIESNFERLKELVEYANGEGRKELFREVEQEQWYGEDERIDLSEEDIGDIVNLNEEDRVEQEEVREEVKIKLEDINRESVEEVTEYLEGVGINTVGLNL